MQGVAGSRFCLRLEIFWITCGIVIRVFVFHDAISRSWWRIELPEIFRVKVVLGLNIVLDVGGIPVVRDALAMDIGGFRRIFVLVEILNAVGQRPERLI